LQAKNIFSANELSDVNFCDPKVLQLPRAWFRLRNSGGGCGCGGRDTMGKKSDRHADNFI